MCVRTGVKGFDIGMLQLLKRPVPMIGVYILCVSCNRPTQPTAVLKIPRIIVFIMIFTLDGEKYLLHAMHLNNSLYHVEFLCMLSYVLEISLKSSHFCNILRIFYICLYFYSIYSLKEMVNLHSEFSVLYVRNKSRYTKIEKWKGFFSLSCKCSEERQAIDE